MTPQNLAESGKTSMAEKSSRTIGFVVAGAVFLVALLAVAVLIAAAAPEGAPSAAPAQNVGTITGSVVFQGTPPTRQRLDMSSDPVCSAKNPQPVIAQDGAVNPDGAVPNAFVYLKDVSGVFNPPSEPVVLDQNACMYVPHVVGVMVNQPLRIISSDATTHNIHFMSTQNPDWNQSQPPGAPPLVRKFAHPEIMIKVHCNEHPWMSAYVAVVSNPFYSVTGDSGAFTIKNVPPGEYTIGSWTAVFGTQDQKVTVKAGETTQVKFTFTSSGK